MPKERVQFNVRLDGRKELIDAVKAYVDSHGLTMSEFVATALDNALAIGVKPKASHLVNQEEQHSLRDAPLFAANQETVKEERIAQKEIEIAKVIQMAISVDRLPILEEQVVRASELIANACGRLTNLEERLGKLRGR